MWIRTTKGNLINLDHATRIECVPNQADGGKRDVVLYYSHEPSLARSVDPGVHLTPPLAPAVAQEVLDKLTEAMRSNVNVLELESVLCRVYHELGLPMPAEADDGSGYG